MTWLLTQLASTFWGPMVPPDDWVLGEVIWELAEGSVAIYCQPADSPSASSTSSASLRANRAAGAPSTTSWSTEMVMSRSSRACSCPST
jgi:hypothetical protein